MKISDLLIETNKEIVHDSDLQNEPLELKIMDYDQITYNDAIGSVFIDLNPLLTWDSGAQISGWFPIYDTLLGIRGELNAQIKLQFFGNKNPFKVSSAGVQFFTTASIPTGFQVASVLGFVSSLSNQDDPEYHWTDSFRTPRKSNESRIKVMFQLSGQIRRLLGKKVLELNGNAVIGFQQYFDYETDQKTITVRAIGTAVKLQKEKQEIEKGSIQIRGESLLINPSSISTTPSVAGIPEIPTVLDEIPEMDLLLSPAMIGTQPMPQTSRSDAVFLTMTRFPKYSIIGTGGFVCATSIKPLENDEREVRELWWNEVREEIKSHARTVGCCFVIGYSERTSIVDDVLLLYCSGTAVNIDLTQLQTLTDISKTNCASGGLVSSPIGFGDEGFSERVSKSAKSLVSDTDKSQVVSKQSPKKHLDCRSAHITYRRSESPFPMSLQKCTGCKKKLVPEILLSSAEPPAELHLVGNCVLIEAHVCRQKKFKVGENRATVVSESIPFAQYDIHRQLMYKLRIYGLNAVFKLKIQITIGENIMTAVATGTAMYVKTLPAPQPLKVFRTLEVLDDEDKQLLETQRDLMEKSERNRKKIEEFLLNEQANSVNLSEVGDDGSSEVSSSTEEETDEISATQSRLQKKSMVIEIDDEQDEDLVLFLDDAFNDKFQVCNVELPTLPWISATQDDFQMINMMKQKQIDPAHHPNRQLSKIFKSMYQELAFQMAYLSPCSVTGVSYSIGITKTNCVQVYLNAFVSGSKIDMPSELILTEENVLEVDLPTPMFTASVPRESVASSGLNDSRIDDQEEGQIIGEQSISESIDSAGLWDVRSSQRPSIISNPSVRESRVDLQVAPERIELCPHQSIPNSTLIRYLGRISLHFIKESNLVYDSVGFSGLGGFCHVFLMELLAIIKAHVLCLGGNAVVGFNIDQILLDESIKTQGYALLSVSGDVVEVSYN